METKTKILTIKEAAKMLAVSRRTIARAVAKGELKAAFYGLRKNRIGGIYSDSVRKVLSEIVKR